MAADKAEAAVLALNAGVDVEMPEGAAYLNLPTLVTQGRVSEAQIDAAVARVLALKFEAGLFERPYVDPARVLRGTNTAADIALARRAAQRALILLKNDGVLPLDPNAKLKLAVIGPNAQAPLFGGYSGENAKAVGILAGVRAAAGPGIAVTHAEGVWITQPDPKGRPGHNQYIPVPQADNAARLAEALNVAQEADVVLLVLGDRPEVTREAVMLEQPGDRNSLGLFGDQDKLVEAILATGKPVITLLLNGRPLAVPKLAERANALLEAWYLGQEGGNAFADVLFGKVNPGGKLTVSVPRSVGDLPIFYNRHPSAQVNQYVEGRHAPLFPFGFGLSYTSFDLSEPRLARATIGVGEGFSVEVDVTNTGKRAGDEVVQVYIRDDVSSVPRPVLELKAFCRITLKPGEKHTVRFDLAPDALAFWNIDMRWAVEPGSFTISTGNSSTSLKAIKLVVAG
jgi:beta-glucosidase